MQEIIVLLKAVYVLALQISGAIDQTCSSFAQRTWRRLWCSTGNMDLYALMYAYMCTTYPVHWSDKLPKVFTE